MRGEILTVSEVAQYLRVNPQTVYRKAKAGALPVVRIGRAIRFRKSELDNWLQASSGRLQVTSNQPLATEPSLTT